jgi:hypothetical protein
MTPVWQVVGPWSPFLREHTRTRIETALANFYDLGNSRVEVGF